MDYKPGDSITAEFTTRVFATGVGTNADSTPTGTVNRNGTDDGAVTVTVTNIDTGRYKAVFTAPATYVPGDVLNLTIAATVSSVADKACVGSWKLGWGIISQGTATAGGNNTITLQTALGADSFGRGALIVVMAGTGAGQARQMLSYVNSTKVATTDRNWVTNPDSTSVYAILFADLPAIDAGGFISRVTLVDTLTTYTGNTPQTGDSYARLGAPAGASVSADIAAIRTNTNVDIPALIAALNNLSAAQVNAEVVDCLNVDTYAEPGQGTPAATTTLQLKISYCYKAWRNKSIVNKDDGFYYLYNDDTTTIGQKGTVADDGTAFTRGEIATGA